MVVSAGTLDVGGLSVVVHQDVEHAGSREPCHGPVDCRQGDGAPSSVQLGVDLLGAEASIGPRQEREERAALLGLALSAR